MTINITHKPIMNYVLQAQEEIKTKGKTELVSCGRGITRACTISELTIFTLRKTKFASTYEDVCIKTTKSNEKNITQITIKLKKI